MSFGDVVVEKKAPECWAPAAQTLTRVTATVPSNPTILLMLYTTYDVQE